MRLFNYFFCLIFVLTLLGCDDEDYVQKSILKIDKIKTYDNIKVSTATINVLYSSDNKIESYTESVDDVSDVSYWYNYYDSSVEIVSDTIYVEPNYKSLSCRSFTINELNNLLTSIGVINKSWDDGVLEESSAEYKLYYDDSDKLESIVSSSGAKYLFTWAGTLLVRIEYLKNSSSVWVGDFKYNESITNPSTALDLFGVLAVRLGIFPNLFEGIPYQTGLKVSCMPQSLEVISSLGTYNCTFSYSYDSDNNVNILGVYDVDGGLSKSIIVSYY